MNWKGIIVFYQILWIDRDDVIGCESVMNWKGIIVSCKIRFYVGRDGVIKCDSVMNWKDITVFYQILWIGKDDVSL